MTKTLRDFLAERETEIRQQIVTLKAELQDIKAAKSAIDGSSDSAPGAPSGRSFGPTIKEMIVDVLADKPDGETADTIIDLVREKHATSVPRSSMSPQLSRLKTEGKLALNSSNNHWMLIEFVSPKTTEAPDAKAQEASEVTDEVAASSDSGHNNPNWGRF